MKINVSVDLSDFYNGDDESSFSEQIKEAISYDVKAKILSDWREKIKEEFNNQVKAKIEEVKQEFITKEIDELFRDTKLKKRYGGDEMLSISEYVKDELERTTLNSRDLNSRLDAVASKFSENMVKELKNRYDLMFASSMVSKMNELGMLKDNVANMILPSENESKN